MMKAIKASLSIWIGRVLSGVFILFMVFASIMPKLFFPEVGYESIDQLGWPRKFLLLIAAIEIVGTVLYIIPRTSILGAVFMTGLLGGSLATQLRVENPLFTHILFSVYLGLFMWGGLWLRDKRLRALLPFSRKD